MQGAFGGGSLDFRLLILIFIDIAPFSVRERR
jgi:hypothetical protein